MIITAISPLGSFVSVIGIMTGLFLVFYAGRLSVYADTRFISLAKHDNEIRRLLRISSSMDDNLP